MYNFFICPVRPTFLEFKNRKIEMKTLNEEEYEEFFEEEYFTFQSPNLGENQTFWNFFWFR